MSFISRRQTLLVIIFISFPNGVSDGVLSLSKDTFTLIDAVSSGVLEGLEVPRENHRPSASGLKNLFTVGSVPNGVRTKAARDTDAWMRTKLDHSITDRELPCNLNDMSLMIALIPDCLINCRKVLFEHKLQKQCLPTETDLFLVHCLPLFGKV